jgi:putative ABC transport system permease protein
VDLAAESQKIRNLKLNSAGPKDAILKPGIFLYPMSQWHLFSEFKNGIPTGGAIDTVWLFGVIGVFVLLLACINFMNLSTARSEKRAKEVGIRKAVGSLRGQLIAQFYLESLLYALLAFAGAVVLVWLALPYFNTLSGKEVLLPWNRMIFWALGLGFTVITGLVAGSYPALYLSHFQPVKVLKGVFEAGRYAAMPRRVLVVLQFSVSMVLMIGTVIVFRQIQYAKDRPVGYTREGLVTIPTATTDVHDHFDAVQADLLRSGMVSSIAESSSPATAIFNGRSDVSWEGKAPAMTPEFGQIAVSADYGKAVGWQFMAGRDITTMKTDSDALVLNATAVKYMGLRDPVGQLIRVGKRDLRVVGVVRDMVMASPYEPAKPTLFRLGKGAFDYVDIRINPAVSPHAAISAIAAVCKTYVPAVPFTYTFVDEDYARKFVQEERVGALARLFAVLAIFISALGLYGMASFVAEQRVREIGVRKILGASVFSLWRLLSKEFVVLTGVALLIAVPLGYLFMEGWLRHYAYRTGMPWWIFAGTGLLSMGIALLTVSYHAVRTAMMNPVKSLRTE